MNNATPMTIPKTTHAIRRVVVALDASPCSRTVLRSAARLSVALGAEMEGLFVEDVRLLYTAELPVAQELRLPGGRRVYDRPTAEHELRVVARTVEAWAGEIAQREKVEWRFRVLRGEIAPALMEAAGQEALLSLGRYGASICPRPARIGSVARSVLSHYNAPLFLLHREMQPGQPILLTGDDLRADDPLLSLALSLAQSYDSPLILITDDGEAADALRAALAEETPALSIYRLQSGNLASQIAALSQGTGGIVLSHRRDPQLAELECGLLLM